MLPSHTALSHLSRVVLTGTLREKQASQWQLKLSTCSDQTSWLPLPYKAHIQPASKSRWLFLPNMHRLWPLLYHCLPAPGYIISCLDEGSNLLCPYVSLGPKIFHSQCRSHSGIFLNTKQILSLLCSKLLVSFPSHRDWTSKSLGGSTQSGDYYLLMLALATDPFTQL